MGLAELALAFAWLAGANGFLIERQLAPADTVLPVAWALPLSDEIRVVFHDRPGWAMAFYLPPVASTRDPALLEPPRIVLRASVYLAADGLVAPEEMAVDVSEYYFHGLLEAALDRAGGEDYLAAAETRAAAFFVELPETHRAAAYRAAVADFGAHLLSIANEIDRLARRRGRDDFCRLLASEAPLLRLWRRSFEAVPYPGRVTLPPTGDGTPAREVTTRAVLERADKDLFVWQVLGARWTGDPAIDFAGACQ